MEAQSYRGENSQAEEIRHTSDYDTFYIASKEKNVPQIETADKLIQLVADYYESKKIL